jgi:hypothetical protein
MNIDTEKIKHESERKVLAAGGEICDWLPYIEFTKIRSDEEVVNRALILNAMVNIAFKAPVHVIRDWIQTHNLALYLSTSERGILDKENAALNQSDLTNLFWYIEALWAFLWATQIITEMRFNEPIPDTMASYCPDLKQNEGPAKFTERMRLRSYNEIYEERDLYYRVMWYCRHLELSGRNHSNFKMDVVMERRKALEWIMDSTLDWDDVPQDT